MDKVEETLVDTVGRGLACGTSGEEYGTAGFHFTILVFVHLISMKNFAGMSMLKFRAPEKLFNSRQPVSRIRSLTANLISSSEEYLIPAVHLLSHCANGEAIRKFLILFGPPGINP